MKRFRFLPAILAMILVSSCQDEPQSTSSGEVHDSMRIPTGTTKTTSLSLFGEAESIDSLVILYFTDKVRFRYYTFYTTSKTQHLSLLRENLLADTIGNNNCVKDGTIYGYIKGNIYTTFYFNLSDTCKGLRLFKNGKLYSFPLSTSFQSELFNLKRKSKSP